MDILSSVALVISGALATKLLYDNFNYSKKIEAVEFLNKRLDKKNSKLKAKNKELYHINNHLHYEIQQLEKEINDILEENDYDEDEDDEDDWKIKRLDVILEKINKVGFNNLTDLEKQFLTKYKK